MDTVCVAFACVARGCGGVSFFLCVCVCVFFVVV